MSEHDNWAAQRDATRVAIQQQGWTQAELAAELGITQKHLSRILVGHDDGTVQLWARLADQLGCKWTLSIGSRS